MKPIKRYSWFPMSKILTPRDRRMSRTWFQLVPVLLLLASSLSLSLPVQASEQCSQIFDLDQAAVFQRIEKNNFETSRDIYDYQSMLHPGFIHSLRNLRSDQHWMDLGAGKAKAQISFLKSFRDISLAPRATAVAYKLDRWFRPPKFNGKLEIKEGAFEKHNTSEWKKVDIATDLFGVLSYTHDFSSSLQKIVDLLNVRGELYIMTTPWRTHFSGRSGSFKLDEFLREIPGLQVDGEYGTLRITKLKETVQIPRLELVEIKDEAPPSRLFQIVD